MRAPVIFLCAGEASGDLLGADLMRGLKAAYDGDIVFIGVGGALMEKQGLTSLFPMNDLSVMGIVEIIPRLLNLRRRFFQAIDLIKRAKPDLILTIDSPGFNFKIAKKVKRLRLHAPVVHYVAPSVWAWRPGRARKVAKFLDHLLTLLPFEPAYFTKEGLEATFVGHPIASWKEPPFRTDFLRRYNLPVSGVFLTLLPGSRFSELKYMAPVFLETVTLLAAQQKVTHIMISTFPHFLPFLEEVFSKSALPVVFVTDEDDKKRVYSHTHIALATSGTVALELSAFQVPCIIAYKASWITYKIIKKLVTVKYASLPNLLLDDLIIEEYIQDQCKPMLLARAVISLLENDEKRARMKAQMTHALSMLNPPLPFEKAGDCAAHAIITTFLKDKP